MKKNYLKWFQLFAAILMAGHAASEEISTDEKVLLETLDYAAHYEIILNAPPKDVWPYMVDFELWLPYKVVHIEGEKNKAGELNRFTNTKGESFYQKVLNIIPFKHFSEKVGVNRHGVGPGAYGHLGLSELDGKTKLNLDVFIQVSIVPTQKEEIDNLREQHVTQFLENMERNMVHLKNLVEAK